MTLVDDLKQDVRFALRMIRTHRALTAAIVLTVALGVGATTAIFSVVNAVLLRPFPWRDSDRVVWLRERAGGGTTNVAAGVFYDWSEGSRLFAATALWQGRTFNVTDGEPTRFPAARVTPGYFQVFNTAPAVGRYFLPNETEASRVAVLSHVLWQTRFKGDSSIVGRIITLNGDGHTVVGVTPPEHSLTPASERLWTILTPTPAMRRNYGSHSYLAWATLKPGVTLRQAQASLDRISRDVEQREPAMTGRGAAVELFRDVVVRDHERTLWILMAAVTLVLLIGCVNVASLLLARATARRKEMAIRNAVGGTRVRIIRQLLTESALLAAMGGALGLVLARLGLRFLAAAGPSSVPRLSDARLQSEVVAFAVGTALISMIVFGAAPALRATRLDLQAELREGGSGSRVVVRDRVRAGLVVTEFAVALLLLVCAGLFIRSAQQLQRVGLGFEPSGVTILRVALPPDRYDSAAKIAAAFDAIVGEMRSVPGVQTAGAGTRVPMFGTSLEFGIVVEGRGDAQTALGHLRIVTPGYFETLAMPPRHGRLFAAADVAPNAPQVVVVNETFARRTYPGESPVGKRISGWEASDRREWREIVGVVGDVRADGQERDVPPEVYAPHTQAPLRWWSSHQRTMAIVAKGASGASVAPEMRAALWRVDRQLPAFDVQPMDDVVERTVAPRRFNTVLLSLLGAVGLILAAIGIYGVMAFFVSQRTHEIGVRVALGATTASVVMLVLQQAMFLGSFGVVLGAIASLWGTQAIGAQLFATGTRDPATFVLSAVVLLLVALLGALIPAWRAARVEPIRALTSP